MERRFPLRLHRITSSNHQSLVVVTVEVLLTLTVLCVGVTPCPSPPFLKGFMRKFPQTLDPPYGTYLYNEVI